MIKNDNIYTALLVNYKNIPKSVLAAIAVSFIFNGGVRAEDIDASIMKEWEFLYRNNIVPQKPKKMKT